MVYDRKVKYLDYMEGGTRVRGAGFVKLEARDGILRMELSVTGLHRTDTFARDVVLCGRDREENCGRIEIAAGRGQFRQQWRNLEDIGGTGIGYGELGGLRITLGPGREISCRWQSCNEAARQKPYGAGRRVAAETAGARAAAAGMVDAAGARVAVTGMVDAVGARMAGAAAARVADVAGARMADVSAAGMMNVAGAGVADAAAAGMVDAAGARAVDVSAAGMVNAAAARVADVAGARMAGAAAAGMVDAAGARMSGAAAAGMVNAAAARVADVAGARMADVSAAGMMNAAGAVAETAAAKMADVSEAGMVDAAGARVADAAGAVADRAAARVADTTVETMATGREARREAWGMEAQKAPGGMAWDGLQEEAAQKVSFGEEPSRKDAFMQKPNPQKADPDKDGMQLAARFPRSTARQWQEGELQGSSVSMEYAGKEGTQKEAEAVRGKRDDRPMGTGVEWEDHGNGSRRNRVQAGREGIPVDWNSRGARGRSAAGQGGTPAKASGEPDRKPVRLMEDKWQQLWAIYPHIRPFQDAREYLSIGPSDFVLFPEASYKAVNNSFLLHGYYNYHHLLLARVERKGEDCYYIGVPGNFYEREKQVAIMFGFESFECAEEPAQAGDFGYYMMRAEI